MGRSRLLYEGFLKNLGFEATVCQDNLFRTAAEFICSDEDIMVVNGYAGTGKTSALASIVSTLSLYKVPCILLAPTGRAAKVLSSYAGRQAYTIHKHIYRQKSVGENGVGMFSMGLNESRGALFIVDEVSLIGIDQGGQSMAAFGSGNLLYDLIEFVRKGPGCKLLLVGDSAQLPPVGNELSPALSEDYMDTLGAGFFVTLKTVVRQQEASGILYNATLLRRFIVDEDCFPLDPLDLQLSVDPFPDVERVSGGELIEKISEAYERYGEDEVAVLCRSNRRAIRYNAGIRATVKYTEERLVRGDKLMIVRNCYQFVDGLEGVSYIANGDVAKLVRIGKYEERYGLHFAEAWLSLPDYGDQEFKAKVILDTLESESASLTFEQQNQLYLGVNEDYSHIRSKRKRYEAVREDLYYNALQIKYANAITCHKSQGGQWKCVFIDNPFWQDQLFPEDLKWLYTAVTRGVEKVFLVNFRDEFFE